MLFRSKSPAGTAIGISAGIAVVNTTTAAQLGTMAKRCDAMAPPEVRASPEFRRLLEGIAVSLAYVPTAIRTRDVDMLHRVIGELRAFDQLLTFRYG